MVSCPFDELAEYFFTDILKPVDNKHRLAMEEVVT
jgi:hypothetical protein